MARRNIICIRFCGIIDLYLSRWANEVSPPRKFSPGLLPKATKVGLLEEVEKLDEIEVIRDGKEKYYLHKVIRHH